MKIIFLLPPSESKNPDGKPIPENISYNFEKPIDIAKNATQKDLKCTGNRYDEAIFLNKNTNKSVVLPAILRYNGVMFKAFDYNNFSSEAKNFFDENFRIISGFYGIIKPKDWIVNYKLPASTKGLYDFWGEKILQTLIDEKPDYIVNLLSGEYEKLFKFEKNHKKLSNTKVININFVKKDGKKISHGVKKIKGEFIKKICENEKQNFLQKHDIEWKNNNIGTINIVIK